MTDLQSVVTVSQYSIYASLLPIGSVTTLTAMQHVMMSIKVRNDGVAFRQAREVRRFQDEVFGS